MHPLICIIILNSPFLKMENNLKYAKGLFMLLTFYHTITIIDDLYSEIYRF